MKARIVINSKKDGIEYPASNISGYFEIIKLAVFNKSSSDIGFPLIDILSLKTVTYGEINEPTDNSFVNNTDFNPETIEPFPLVPAI